MQCARRPGWRSSSKAAVAFRGFGFQTSDSRTGFAAWVALEAVGAGLDSRRKRRRAAGEDP